MILFKSEKSTCGIFILMLTSEINELNCNAVFSWPFWLNLNIAGPDVGKLPSNVKGFLGKSEYFSPSQFRFTPAAKATTPSIYHSSEIKSSLFIYSLSLSPLSFPPQLIPAKMSTLRVHSHMAGKFLFINLSCNKKRQKPL